MKVKEKEVEEGTICCLRRKRTKMESMDETACLSTRKKRNG
jgi:hypothetical protein